MRRVLGVLLAAGTAASLFVLPLLVSPFLVSPVWAAVRATDPGKLIETVTAEVTEIARTSTGASREAAVRQVLRDNFDLSYMGSAALGTHWAQASEQQRVRFLAAVETSEARAYGERLGNFPGSTVTVGKAISRPNGVWIVDSSLNLAAGQSIKLEWEVHDGGQGLRIADVRVAGVSLFMARRSDFDSYIQSHGGTVEPLVKVLEARVAR
jgi:phospholipid transport system substrate-binding protein